METARRVDISKNPNPTPPVTELQSKILSATTPSPSTPTSSTPTTTADVESTTKGESEEGSGEESHDPQGAYNPLTGEINWDCPCLGGMADGPCGPEFKEAFSCFVFSEEEPKGVDCVERFRGMQECFRRYPEVYGAGESISLSAFFLSDRTFSFSLSDRVSS